LACPTVKNTLLAGRAGHSSAAIWAAALRLSTSFPAIQLMLKQLIPGGVEVDPKPARKRFFLKKKQKLWLIEVRIECTAYLKNQKLFGSFFLKKELLAFTLRQSGSMPVGISLWRTARTLLRKRQSLWRLASWFVYRLDMAATIPSVDTTACARKRKFIIAD